MAEMSIQKVGRRTVEKVSSFKEESMFEPGHLDPARQALPNVVERTESLKKKAESLKKKVDQRSSQFPAERKRLQESLDNTHKNQEREFKRIIKTALRKGFTSPRDAVEEFASSAKVWRANVIRGEWLEAMEEGLSKAEFFAFWGNLMLDAAKKEKGAERLGERYNYAARYFEASLEASSPVFESDKAQELYKFTRKNYYRTGKGAEMRFRYYNNAARSSEASLEASSPVFESDKAQRLYNLIRKFRGN